jgi:uncharacterized YigZ family protein
VYRPTGTFSAEYEVKGSRFLARCLPVEGEKDAKQRAAACKREFSDASHVVWAFRSGREGETFGFSDDGEPRGTAGRPVFEVLKGADLTRAAVLVVRWFGGTKLGTGGLVKAYTRAAQLVLEKTAREELIERLAFTLRIPYRCYEKGRELLIARKALITGEEFTEEVLMYGKIPEAEAGAAGGELRDLSNGEARFSFGADPRQSAPG